MLVVIAIIAVLVAIIIPVVTNSTTKAAAATDAANLRSIKAEVTTMYLADDAKLTINDSGVAAGYTEASMKDVSGLPDEASIQVTVDKTTDEITVTYGGFHIADFAKVAEDGGSLEHVNNCGTD